MSDLTTQTPVEIDTRLATLFGERSTLGNQIASLQDHVNGEVARHLGRGWKGTSSKEEVATYLETAGDYDSVRRYSLEIADLQEKMQVVQYEINTLQAEFTRRGGWTRAYLALSSSGHVHSSMDCSTCYYTGYDGMGNWRDGTAFQWLVDLADHDESEIIEKAGERACTVCYPNAPVGTLSRPTQIFSKSEVEKQAARVEREAKRVAANAAKVFVEGWVERNFRTGEPHYSTREFKTERAVTNAITSNLKSLCHYGTEHPSAIEWMSQIQSMRDALAAKGVDYDYEAALAKARKAVVAEARRYGSVIEAKY